MKLCVHGLAASVCAQVRPEVNSYRLKRTQSSMLRSTVLFATIMNIQAKFGTVAKAVCLCEYEYKPVERDQEFPRFHLECGHGDE